MIWLHSPGRWCPPRPRGPPWRPFNMAGLRLLLLHTALPFPLRGSPPHLLQTHAQVHLFIRVGVPSLFDYSWPFPGTPWPHLLLCSPRKPEDFLLHVNTYSLWVLQVSSAPLERPLEGQPCWPPLPWLYHQCCKRNQHVAGSQQIRVEWAG